MDVKRWSTLQETFDQLADMQPEDQASALRALGETDPAMAQEVHELLVEDASGRQLPEMNVESLFQEALGQDEPILPTEGQIGPYRILRLLGEGGMGVVYLAERTDIGGQVAIKLLRDAWLSPLRRRRFALEQQMLGLLTHSSIARIYDAGTTKDGTPWFVMEFSDGVPITDYLQKHPSSVREAMELIRAVCETVRHAHGLAIIHRDLKPSNILITDDGQVKLLDFGIAKQMDMVNRGSTATTTGFRLFTPAYAAPELQLENRVGVFTDIYSVGVILYQLITGSLPYPEEFPGDRDALQPSKKIRKADAGSERALSTSQWGDIDAICMKALEKRPENRYLSMDALIEDISAFLEDRPISAKKNAFLYTTGKFLHRNRIRVLTAAIAFLIVIVGTVVFTVRLARARDAAAKARDQAVAEAARSASLQHFTESLFTGGASYGYPSPGIKVTQMLSRGREQALQMTGDPQLQAAMFQSLGTAYNALGYYADAEPLLKRAQQGICSSGPSLQCADVEESRAESLHQIGTRGDSLKLDRDVLRIRQERLPANDVSFARAMTNLGLELEVDGDQPKATEAFTKAVETATAVGHPTRELAFALESLGSRGLPYNDSRALDYTMRSAEINRQLFGENSFEYARSETTIGEVLTKYGRVSEAERYERSGLTHVQNWSGPDEPITVRYALRLVEVLDQEKKFSEANALCLHALEIIKKSDPPSSLEEGDVYFDLGFGDFERGDLRSAELNYQAVLALAHQGLNVGAVDLEYSEIGLADIYQQEGDYKRAEPILRQELAKSAPASGYSIVATHSILGRILLHEGRFVEAESELLKAYAWFSKDSAMRPQTAQTYRDLATVETRLGKPKESARFVAELRAHPK